MLQKTHIKCESHTSIHFFSKNKILRLNQRYESNIDDSGKSLQQCAAWSTKIIEDIAKNIGPRKYFISLGYAGWAPGQLEQEIIDNSWIKINEKLDLIFDVEAEKKWEKAIKFTGIDFSKFSSLSGNA